MAASITMAEDYECRGPLGDVTIPGKLLVPDDATCSLKGTKVQGAIVVKSRATLRVTNADVTGGIQGEGPRTIVVKSSTLGNSFQISKSEPGGMVTVSSTKIKGDVQLSENHGAVKLKANQISGSVQANKNQAGVEISDNRIDNGLQCQENVPPPTGGGNIAKQKQAQCLNL